MSLIFVDGFGATEKDVARNWAAEYARRLYDELLSLYKADFAELESQHESDIKQLEAQHKTDVNNLKEADAGVLRQADTAVDTANAAKKAAEDAYSEAASKLSAVPVASTTTVGGIKLHNSNGQNRSGLSVGADGSCVVVTRANGGLSRDGAGQLQINTGGVTSGMLANGAVTAEKLGSDISIATPDQIQAPYHIGGNHLITAENAQYLSGEDFINDFCKIMWPKYNIAGVEEFCDWIDAQVAKLNALQN